MCQSNQNLNSPPLPATHGYFTVVCARGGREFLFVPGGQGIFVCAQGGREFLSVPRGAGNLNLAQVGHFNQKCQDFPV